MGGGLAGLASGDPCRDLPLQYLQLKKKLEDEFPGCLDIVSLGDGGKGSDSGPTTCPAARGSLTLRPGLPFPGRGGVSRRAPQPLQHLCLPPLQCGEGTPQVTGFFEVTVAGKLVHSKKVCLSVCPASFLDCWGLGVGLVSWTRLTTSIFCPQRGDGYVDTESKFLKLVAAIKAALAQG
ncbi:hypothetical protein HJG60_009038 [Phyllostomus discolor]|uniref:Selenoprotein W n=1 Tax=Phyllostomus discolor TaxID=89673 RepID=A0A834DEX5_9CHIR|nr:hypothetical protein HJG60_009038 [Phyllostomus discolor]